VLAASVEGSGMWGQGSCGPYHRPVRRHLLLVAAAAVLVAACASDADPGERRAEQARAAAREAGLDDEVAAFLALAGRGPVATFQVTYPGPEPGTSLVVANDPPDRRVDLVEGDVVLEVRLVIDGEALECIRDEEAGRIRRCTRTDAFVEPPGLFDEAALETLATALTERREDFTFAVGQEAIAGVEARCLVTEVREGRERPELGARGEICVSPEGALLRIDQGEEAIEATAYTTEIPDNTFARPDRDVGE
jgi:hypothetical protein